MMIMMKTLLKMRSSLCDFSDAYVLAKGTTTAAKKTAAGAAVDNINKQVVFENFASFNSFITKINNTQVDYAEDIYIVMSMYNLIEYSNAYSKTSGILLWCYSDEPAIEDTGNVIDCPAGNNNGN